MSAWARDRSGWWRMRPERAGPILALFLAVLALVACSGPAPSATGPDPIRIGVVTSCEGVFAGDHDPTLAGAELPLIQRGAHLIGVGPEAGVTGFSVGSRPVELLIGCERWGDRQTTISALSDLVERGGADIVIGPLWAQDGIAVREFARAHPEVTVVATDSEQATTLKRSVPNLYRFEPDEYQWTVPLGVYARRTLGWKSAATFGEDNPVGWQVDGFIAAFCSLGGRVTPSDRLIPAAHGSADLGSVVARTPEGVDGLFVTALTGGGPLGGTDTLIPGWQRTHAPLKRHLLVGWGLLYPPDRRLRGVVGASPDPFLSTPAWNRYNAALAQAFPHLKDPRWVNQPYYDAMEPVLEALEKVNGDLSDGQRRFAAALAHLRYHSPEGLITLDRHRQAIAPIYLGRVVVSGGAPGVRQIAVFRHVHQTLDGYFSPTSPSPSHTRPPC
jgi:branched-chain amino acid transport system substrate-binding protein